MKLAHLHVHSHYSLLDGLPKIKDLVEYAAQLNYKALALTDHGNLSGAIEFYNNCLKYGLKPIIGIETYVAPRSRFLKEGRQDAANYHLVLLAENEKGLKNLYKLSSLAWLEGFYYRPRVDKDLLKQYNEGLIALSACPSGEIGRKLLINDFEGALKTAKEYQEIFGKENFFLELGLHPKVEDSRKIESGIVRLSEILNIPLVATQDVHYLKKDDNKIHDVFVAIQTGKNIDDNDRLSLREDDFSLISPEEMIEKFKKYPQAISNIEKIVERCNLEIELGKIKMPIFPLPPGETDHNSYLRKLVEAGLSKRGLELTDEVKKRLDYELSIIEKTNFSSYFLIVQDFVNWAKEHNIFVGPGRGSAAGSLVAYLLRITEVNPIKYNLLFERFLTPDRISFPDIDIDFSDIRREEVFECLKKKYNEENVAQIITFGKMAARAAIRDAGRALGYSYSFCDKIARLIPPTLDLTESENLTDLKDILNKNEEAKRLWEVAKKLEGTIRHVSVHACGIVIAPQPLVEYLPLQLAPQGEKRIITQYDMYSIEQLGLLKIDILGLRTLSIIETTKNLIKERRGVEIEIDVEKDDKKTYELLCQGLTEGVFQLESAGMKRFLKASKPKCLEDIIITLAIFRPGPMDLIPSFLKRKFGKEKIEYLHPKLEPILKNTYGIAIFQEQLIQIAKDLAGFSPSEADALRKAVGKKIGELLELEGQKLIAGMIKNNIDEQTAKKIWEWFKPFARYGFNRSHAVCYAFLAYYTAFLKAYYPVEFITSCLIHEGTDTEKIEKYIREAKNLKIDLLPADINESSEYFTIVDNNKIRFGLLSIKNVGKPLVEEIIKERELRGRFKSINDFLSRIKHKDLNKKSLESLIKSGAFDSLHSRESLYYQLEDLLTYSQKMKNFLSAPSLFQTETKAVSFNLKKEIRKINKMTILQWEKELLGIYLSGHPFEEYKKIIGPMIPEIETIKKNGGALGSEIQLAGVINKVKRSLTKNKEVFAIAELEDLSGRIEIIIFPKVYEKFYTLLSEGRIIKVNGKIDNRGDSICLIVNDLEDISDMPSRKQKMLQRL